MSIKRGRQTADWCDFCDAPQRVMPDGEHHCKESLGTCLAVSRPHRRNDRGDAWQPLPLGSRTSPFEFDPAREYVRAKGRAPKDIPEFYEWLKEFTECERRMREAIEQAYHDHMMTCVGGVIRIEGTR